MSKHAFGWIVCLIGLVLTTSAASSAAVKFGAKLDIHTQPSNAGNGIYCSIGNAKPDCTWVLMDAYQCEFGSCVNGHLAPKTGRIAQVSIIACAPGSFVLQIATMHPGSKRANVTHSGPLITYKGDSHHCNGARYEIETFNVNVPVRKGQYLAVATQKLGFVRCSGGGNNMLLYSLPLPDGGPLRTANGDDGCFMLLQATYAP
jgi:hypothetical protein